MSAVAKRYGVAAGVGKLALAAMLLAAPALAEPRIAAFGDSLTAGLGLPEGEGFVPRLEAWLRANGAPDAEVINAGVSGDTTAGGLARAEWVLADDVDAVILALGGNDLLRGIDPATTRANLDGILDAIGARDLPVILAGLPAPANYGPEYRAAFDAIYPELAAEHGAVLYRSFLGALGDSLDGARAYMQADGVHPNAEGVERIVEDIGPVVLEMIGAGEEGRGRAAPGLGSEEPPGLRVPDRAVELGAGDADVAEHVVVHLPDVRALPGAAVGLGQPADRLRKPGSAGAGDRARRGTDVVQRRAARGHGSAPSAGVIGQAHPIKVLDECRRVWCIS